MKDTVLEALEASKKAKKFKKPETYEELVKLKDKYLVKFNKMQKKFDQLLKEHKIQPHEHEKIMNLKQEFESIGSCIIYDWKRFRGRSRYLRDGTHPKFSWYGWNDDVSSIGVLDGYVVLYQHTWLRGSRLWLWHGWYYSLGWFNERASSATVNTYLW